MEEGTATAGGCEQEVISLLLTCVKTHTKKIRHLQKHAFYLAKMRVFANRLGSSNLHPVNT